MKKNWKRILATALAACMIFCDSSLVYAAESKPIEEISAAEETLVPEETSAVENTLVPEEISVDEDSDEGVLEEEIVLEETVLEETDTSGESVEDEEKLEIVTSEETVDQEEVISEMMEITEKNDVNKFASSSLNWVTVNQTYSTGILSETEGKTYQATYYFQPTETGYYGFQGIEGSFSAYVGTIDNDAWNGSGTVDAYYKVSDDNETIESYFEFEADKVYQVSVSQYIDAGKSVDYTFVKDSGDTTEVLSVNGSAIDVIYGEKKIVKIDVQEPFACVLYATDSIEMDVIYGTHSSEAFSDRAAMKFSVAESVYFVVTTDEDATGNAQIQLVAPTPVSVEKGSRVSIGADETVIIELDPEVGETYYVKCATDLADFIAFNSEKETDENFEYEEFVDDNDSKWIKFTADESLDRIRFVGYSSTEENEFWVTDETGYLDCTRTLVLDSIYEILNSSEDLSYTDEWKYIFIPDESGFYYVESENCTVKDIGILADDGTYQYNQWFDNNYKLVETEDYQKIVTCYKLTAGENYEICLTGEIPANSLETFVIRVNTTDETEELNLGDTVSLTEGTKALYKVNETENMIGRLDLSQPVNMYVHGDVVCGHRTSDARNYTMYVQKDEDYYIEFNPNSNINVSWTEVTPSSVEVGNETIIEAEGINSYVFTPESDKGYAVTVDAKSWDISALKTDGSYVRKSNNNQKTYYYRDCSDIEKIIVMAEVDSENAGSILVEETESNKKITLDTFTGTIKVLAGQTVTVTYEGNHLGDYFIDPTDEVQYRSISTGAGIEEGKNYSFFENPVVGYGLTRTSNSEATDTATFTFELSNQGNYDQEISIFNSSQDEYVYDYFESGERFSFYDIEDLDAEEYVGYFCFEPDTTTLYSHGDLEWVMMKDTDGYVRADQHSAEDNSVILYSGKSYILKFSSEQNIDADPMVKYKLKTQGDRTELSYSRLKDESCVQTFRANVAGTYSCKRDNENVELWKLNYLTDEWEYLNRNSDDSYSIEAGQEYLVYFSMRDTFGLKRQIKVLDYDYYKALIQSGGAVSVNGTEVTIDPKDSGFNFSSVLLSLFGIKYYEEDYKDAFTEGNSYWVSDEGSYVASEYYKISEGANEYNLVSHEYQEAVNDDIVVIKYEPEIVWVESMEISAERTTIGLNDTVEINVDAKSATEKYPLDNPIFSYVSSNPKIASVDEYGVVTGHKAGTVTITVAADVAARYAENCPEKIINKTIKITVSPKYNINYVNVTGPEGYLTENNPTVYYKSGAMTLTAPEANTGYEFVGWYSNAALTKKISKIAKGSTGDKTVYAKWKLKDYNIDYVLYDGQFAGTFPPTFTMEGGTVLVEPIRHGYKFIDWYYYVEDTNPDDDILETKVSLYNEEAGAYVIPAGLTDDFKIHAEWEWDTTFSLKVNADQGTYVFPYNTATGTWDSVPISLSIESNPSGIIVNKDYYSMDSGDEYNSLEINLYRLDNGEETYITTYYNTIELDAADFNEPGDYRVAATYVHPGQEPQNISAGITIEYEKREYPVQENIEWTRLSNVEEAKTFGDIKIALAESMQVQEAPRSVGGSTIREDLGEERFVIKKETDTEPVEGNLVITKENIVIKNSKNKVVSDSAKIVSGTYTVTLNFGENDRFFNTASSTLKLTYSAVKAAGVDYTALEPSAEDSTKKTDTEGRTAGSTIAYEVALEEFATPMNTTPYTTGVVITPEISTPWGDYKADEVVAVLNENLLGGDDPNETYSVEVYAEEVTFKSKPALLNILATEVDLDTNEPINIRKCVEVTANGTAAGKRNLTITTVIKNEMGEEVERLVSTIKNFTVVNGGANAVKSIDLSVDGIVGKVTTDDTGAVTYLVAKESAARTYNVTWSAKNYEETEIADAAKLTWKSSNSKLASVKAAKDGTVTVTIPKNAQGVADITATAKDAGKKSQTVKFVIVDTSMRLDTTIVTLNSLFKWNNIACVNLYPNILATELGEQPVDALFTNAEIGIYEKVKDGKTYKYQESSIFEVINYDSHTGQLEVKAVTPQTKAKTHTVYIGVKHDLNEETEYHALKIKDVCALPKKPSITLTKSYETAYEGGYAEITLKTNCEVAVVANENGDYKYDIEVIDDRFEIISIDDMLFDGEAKNLKIKVDVKDGALPTGKSTSKTTKNVKFAIGYIGYHEDVKQTATVNITATKNLPKLTVYGEDAYAPVYYTDANLRRVDVVIPVTEALIAGYISDNEEPVDLGLENDETSAWLTAGDSSEELLNITLKDSSKFRILNAMLVNDYSEFTGEVIPAKKGTLDVEEAIVLTVGVKQNQKKNVSLQFAVDSANLKDRSEPISTSKLTIKAAKVASESIKVANSNGNVVKSLTFNSTLAGKESIDLQIVKANNIMNVLSQDMTGDYADSYLVVEGADTNGKKMLQTNALLVNEDQETGTITITSTDNSFNYKSCKLKVTMLVIGDYAVRTKSATLTLNFKKALTPKVTLTNTKWIKGLFEGPAGYENASVTVKAKISNMPVGAEITNVRFADPADYSKYDIVDFDVQSGTCYLIPRVDAKIPVGKDKIDMVYDICTASGDVLTVNTSFTLTVSESISMKVNEKSINLYNSAAGDRYGKYVTFYDAKGHAVKVTDILNAAELKKAGINFVIEGNEGYVLPQEEIGQDAVKFYVAPELKRGTEKTYTVKAKVALVDAVELDDSGNSIEMTWNELTGTTKTVTFKIVLKK